MSFFATKGRNEDSRIAELYKSKAWRASGNKDKYKQEQSDLNRYTVLPTIGRHPSNVWIWRMKCYDATGGNTVEATRLFNEGTMYEVEELLLIQQAYHNFS